MNITNTLHIVVSMDFSNKTLSKMLNNKEVQYNYIKQVTGVNYLYLFVEKIFISEKSATYATNNCILIFT